MKQFFKLRDAGALEKHICRAFDDAHLSVNGKLKEQTQIVNNLLSKSADSKSWVVTQNKPTFSEMKER